MSGGCRIRIPAGLTPDPVLLTVCVVGRWEALIFVCAECNAPPPLVLGAECNAPPPMVLGAECNAPSPPWFWVLSVASEAWAVRALQHLTLPVPVFSVRLSLLMDQVVVMLPVEERYEWSFPPLPHVQRTTVH